MSSISEYNRVIEDVLRTYDPECPQQVQEVFEVFERLLESPVGRAKFGRRFGFGNDPLSGRETQSMVVPILYAIQSAVQRFVVQRQRGPAPGIAGYNF